MRLKISFFVFLIFNSLNMSNGQPDTISSSNLMSGKEMKVTIVHLPMATIFLRTPTGNVTGFGGYMYEQLQWISLHLNFSLSLHALESTAQGGNFTDIWTEMKKKILLEEADIACNAFSGLVFDSKLDLSVLVLSDGFGILTPYPVPKTSRYAHILIFSRNVWFALIVSIIACIAFIELMVIIIKKYSFQLPSIGFSRGFSNLSDIAVYVLATLTNHGGYFRNGHKSVGMIAVVWCFATFVFVNIYSTCLTSYMSLTFQRPAINSFGDLAMAKDYDLTVVKGSNAEVIFLDAKSGKWKEIGDKLRNCPKNLCNPKQFEEAAGKVLESNFVSILTENYIRNYIFKTMTSRHECRVTMAQELMAHRHHFMAVNKKNPFIVDLNKASYWWHAFGLQTYWKKKLLRDAPECQLKYNNNGEFVKVVDKARIKLEQLHVAFYVLFIGYVLALIQFLRERFIR